MLAAGLILARFVHYVAILALFGQSLYAIYAGPSQDLPRRGMQLAMALVALASAVVWYALATASMAGDPAAALDIGAMRLTASETSFGQVWIARIALLVALALCPAKSGRPWTRTVLSGAVLSSVAFTGHGLQPEGVAGAAHGLSDAVHLLAAGAWLGGLWPLGLALRARSGAPVMDPRAAGSLLIRFSGMGYLAVAALALSGFVNSWWLVGSLSHLITTAYGRLLLVKLALAAGMILIAAVNRFVVTPRLSEPSDDAGRWLSRIRRHVFAEQTLGLVIVGIVAALGTIEPPALMQG